MNTKKVLLAIGAIFALSCGMLVAQDQGAAPKTNSKTAQTKTTKTEAKGTAKSGPKLDINSASQDDLEKLPGIGPVTAKKIIDGRPYRTKHELVTKKVVSQSEYGKITEDIVAHQAKSAKAEGPAKKK